MDSGMFCRGPRLVRHEIGHVLGLLDHGRWVALRDGEFFTGDQAVAAFSAAGGSGSKGVPLQGGNNRDFSHWAESALGSELMTPFLEWRQGPDGRWGWQRSLASAITLGALADIGWVVDMSVAEEYTVGVSAESAETAGCLVSIHRPADHVPERCSSWLPLFNPPSS